MREPSVQVVVTLEPREAITPLVAGWDLDLNHPSTGQRMSFIDRLALEASRVVGGVPCALTVSSVKLTDDKGTYPATPPSTKITVPPGLWKDIRDGASP